MGGAALASSAFFANLIAAFGGRHHIRIAELAVPRQFCSCQSFYCTFVGRVGSWHLTRKRLPGPVTPISFRSYACDLIAVFLEQQLINFLVRFIRIVSFSRKKIYPQTTQLIFIPCFWVAAPFSKMRFCEAIKQSLPITGVLDIELKGLKCVANGLSNVRVSERAFCRNCNTLQKGIRKGRIRLPPITLRESVRFG
jgi:hypothetical protein